MLDILKEFLIDEALIVIPVLIILGKFIKETDVIKDKFIPLILLPIGIVFAVLLIGVDVYGVLQGVLVTGAAVFGHQLIKQTKERD